MTDWQSLIGTLIPYLFGAVGLWVVIGKVVEKLLPDRNIQQIDDTTIRGELWRELSEIRERNDALQTRIIETERAAMDSERKADLREATAAVVINDLKDELLEVRIELRQALTDIATLRQAVANAVACVDCPLLKKG